MKEFICSSLIIAALGFPSLAIGESTRIGFVDIEKVMKESKTGSSAQKEYQQEAKRAQGAVDAKKEEFQKRKEAFEKQESSLSNSARTTKREELIGLEKDLKRTFDDSQESLRRKNAQLVGEMLKKVREIVQTTGKSGDYTVILEKGGQGLLYADEGIDITPSVIEKLDASK